MPNGWTLIGEQSKWVPVSAARFSQLAYATDGSSNTASVVIEGSFGEVVDVSWNSAGQ
jgi:hypothetical protein